MRKLTWAIVLLPFFVSAQENSTNQELDNLEFNKKNEITVNVLDLVLAGTLQLGYERFLKNNQSIDFQLSLWDNYSYNYIFDVNYKSKASSIKAAYNIYFSKNKKYKGFVFYPVLKYRFGSIYLDDYNESNNNWEAEEIDVNGFSVGFGLGNKWRIVNNKMTLGIFYEINRDLSRNIDDNYFSKVESRLGVNIGFTF